MNYQIKANLNANNRFIVSDEAMDFLLTMEMFARSHREHLLKARDKKQQQFDEGIFPDFLIETKDIREGDWFINNIPEDLKERRVEITGPVDRKMIINALNSRANIFMADFEDSNSPTWLNCLNGQVNLYDAVRKKISYIDECSKKEYTLNNKTAVLIVRPRGWHLNEEHVIINGKPISASIFDSMLYLFHNAKVLQEQGTGPYFYLPKLESHLEARLWNDIFIKAQELLQLPVGTIKATVLIETITAAFEMHEIIFALRDHIVGLNCGRWDYIFSFIKKFRNHATLLLPDRESIKMTSHFLQSYVTLLIQTCHQRGIHAMGGMAAQIPIKNDELANNAAIAKVYADKKREVTAGHDGTWVAHPGLIPTALEAFNEVMSAQNQLHVIPSDVVITSKDLLTIPTGKITESGVRNNITIAMIYLESWVRGNGCVPINNLMEDAATAEISRAQLWQWLKFSVRLENGLQLNIDLLQSWFDEEYDNLCKFNYDKNALLVAKNLLEKMIFNKEFDDFLTLTAYQYLLKQGV